MSANYLLTTVSSIEQYMIHLTKLYYKRTFSSYATGVRNGCYVSIHKKCKILTIGTTQFEHKYYMRDKNDNVSDLRSVTEEKDLGGVI